MVPQTVLSKARGGHGDSLDILVLVEAVARGSVVEVKVVGDDGELDSWLCAKIPHSPRSEALPRSPKWLASLASRT